jgi:hypothetical protein
MRSFVGQTAGITEIDQFGYFWIGFGVQSDSGKESTYVGHSFAVTADCLRLAQKSSRRSVSHWVSAEDVNEE